MSIFDDKRKQKKEEPYKGPKFREAGFAGGNIQSSGGSGGGAPTDATYITQIANATLTNEQALSTLASGLMCVANGTGVVTSITDSAGLAANISDETGTGLLVFATSPTLTTPRFADLGFIADANGNELIILDTVAAAVNEITYANAATTTNPRISATGGDANVGFGIFAKGTGTLSLNINAAPDFTSIFGGGTVSHQFTGATATVKAQLIDGGTTFFSLAMTNNTGSVMFEANSTVPKIGTFSNHHFELHANNAVGARLTTNKSWLVNTTTENAQLYAVSGSTSRVGLRVDQAANSTVEALQINANIDDTATVQNVVTILTNSNGTPANGFGAGVKFSLETTTTNDQDASDLQVLWTDATHATRTSAIVGRVVESAAALAEVVRFGGAQGAKIVSQAAAKTGLIVDSAASPSVDIMQVRANTSSTVAFAVKQDGMFTYPGLKSLTSAFNVVATTTYATITGYSFDVRAGRVYKVEAQFNLTLDATGGGKIRFSGTATFTGSGMQGLTFDNTANSVIGAVGVNVGTDYTEGLSGSPAAGISVTFRGNIQVNAAGTFTLQFAQQVANGTSTVNAFPSFFQITEVQ